MASTAKPSDQSSASSSAQPAGHSSAKQDLIKYIAKEGVCLNLGNQEKALKALEIVIAGMKHMLKEEKPLRFLGFGTFSVKNIPVRSGRNPRTGDAIEIPAHKRVSFKAGKELREQLNPVEKSSKKAGSKKK